MLLKQILEVNDIVDRADVNGNMVKKYLESYGGKDITVKKIQGDEGSTDFIKIRIPGLKGKSKGMYAPTIGILGRLGGIGARPELTGMVSDADGALTALAAAARILDMQNKGDYLEGDVVVCTHICPNAPTQPHKPVPFMGSPVEMSVVNKAEVDDELDAILSIDTTKGNNIINTRGFAISPTVKEGYILKVSSDIISIMQITTGKLPYVFALSTQDITPYGNGLYHLNSILQPSTATDSPVIGVAITTEVSIPGCATGASHFQDMEEAARFSIEVAKSYGKKECSFYDEEEFELIKEKYGSMKHIQTLGK
ncbi:DUF1177 domain-containing protein [Clostridium autoethanogenum]|uniref:DUF1177 domain-containing protein n=1 Tax=Clostridium autoethanogenum DSM 10061 TaxID=1341692 RepID=A0ABN4BBR5_9CLOT|nr:DUF1177 domain-containing protein [Clostridium autoethanogenum]AGY74512.1 DUF1177 domain-containing protein [Clostridium autoethanogenum DSM 10061]ALU34699.1 hypothetical protein CLAU_0270 [Clostridium autoethanogenum DSM 10061]OVY51418.1 hypothetical protein WX72_01551 [Clostridium autoethanogenum]